MSKESAIAMIPAAAPVTAPADAPTPEAPKELESTRFAHLAAKEQALQKQREEFKKEREQILAEREQIKPLKERFEKFEELKKTDPVAAIKFLEFSDTDLINFLASQEDVSTPEEKAAKAAQKEIQKWKEEQEKEKLENQTKQNEQVLNKFREEIATAVSNDKDKYEFCNFNGKVAEELIYSTVEEVLKTSGEVITVQEAADMVENYYEEQDKAMNSLKKRQPKEAVAEAKEQIAAANNEPLRAEVSPGRPTPKTLTNRATATVASTVNVKETPDQKRARLIDNLRNLGKK